MKDWSWEPVFFFIFLKRERKKAVCENKPRNSSERNLRIVKSR